MTPLYPDGAIVTAIVPPEYRNKHLVSVARHDGKPSRQNCQVMKRVGSRCYWLYVLGTHNNDKTLGRFVMAREDEIGVAT